MCGVCVARGWRGTADVTHGPVHMHCRVACDAAFIAAVRLGIGAVVHRVLGGVACGSRRACTCKSQGHCPWNGGGDVVFWGVCGYASVPVGGRPVYGAVVGGLSRVSRIWLGRGSCVSRDSQPLFSSLVLRAAPSAAVLHSAVRAQLWSASGLSREFCRCLCAWPCALYRGRWCCRRWLRCGSVVFRVWLGS